MSNSELQIIKLDKNDLQSFQKLVEYLMKFLNWEAKTTSVNPI